MIDMTYKDPIIILGSSRSDGNTRTAIRAVVKDRATTLIDLSDLEISYFDYAGSNLKDDFLPLAEKMIHHSKIVLASPVYWYTMSAQMKTFIDRWSHLVTTHKEMGRHLKGKELYLISSYAGKKPTCFETPFKEICNYLDMRYCGCYYYYSGADSELQEKNSEFAKKLSIELWAP